MNKCCMVTTGYEDSIIHCGFLMWECPQCKTLWVVEWPADYVFEFHFAELAKATGPAREAKLYV